MPRSHATHKPPDRGVENRYPQENHIGNLFRGHGEDYIKCFKPSLQHIKLIRSIRLCKTPFLGGKVIRCKDCSHKHYLYFSCGHSHCPICQSIKREQWVDKLKSRLYKVPYVHTIFTLPHELNGLARSNSSTIYNLLMRSSWQTIKQLSNKVPNKRVQYGMTSVLHTFGSDMKYHVHVHCLVTFGGWSENGQWVYPKHKYKIAKYREFSKTYKDLFLLGLKKLYSKGVIVYHEDYDKIISEIKHKRWVVHSTRPTMDTLILENYLARYVNRVAISNSRLQYVRRTEEVRLLYNDYKKQKGGEAAPKAIKTMHPLTAIGQIMQHVLPPYYQKSRHYGLHASRVRKTLQRRIPAALRRNGQTIRTLFEILTQLLKLKPYECQVCGSSAHEILIVKADKTWIRQFVAPPIGRSPPRQLYKVLSCC